MNRIALAALQLFVFAIPWEAVLLVPGVGTVSRLAGIVALPIGIGAVLLRGHLRRPSLFHVLAVAFVLWGGLTVFWSVDRDATLARFSRNVQMLGLVWLVWELAPALRQRRRLMQAYVLGGFVSIGFTYYNYLSGIAISSRYLRYAAPGFNPNDLGFLLVLGLPMAWYLVVSARTRVGRMVNGAYLPAALLAIVMTGSRGAAVTAAIALLVVPWTVPGLRLGMQALVAVGGLVLVLTLPRLVPESSKARLATTIDELRSGTLHERRVVWEAGLRLLPAEPIRGIGAGAFRTAVVPHLGYEKTAHNTYIAVAVEQGIIGLVLFLALMGLALLGVRAAPRVERRIGLVLLLTLGVGLMPRTWEDEKPTWLVLSLVLTGSGPALRRVSPGLRTRPALDGRGALEPAHAH